jgi:hypothetical protein
MLVPIGLTEVDTRSQHFFERTIRSFGLTIRLRMNGEVKMILSVIPVRLYCLFVTLDENDLPKNLGVFLGVFLGEAKLVSTLHALLSHQALFPECMIGGQFFEHVQPPDLELCSGPLLVIELALLT